MALAVAATLGGCGSSPDNAKTEISASATSLHSQASPPTLDANGNPPPNYVLTPNGYFHQSCVHPVPNGATMDQNQNILDSKGNLIEVDPPCAYLPIRVDAAHPTPASDGPLPTLNGWVEWAAQNSTSTPYNAIENYYHVPNAPSNYNGQTDFFFPAFQPNDASVIIQTVLQYGPSKAGGGNYWGLAAWWVITNGNQYYTPLYTGVSSGDLIFNEIYIQSETCRYLNCSDLWNIYGEDENTHYAFGANLWQSTQDPMRWAFGAVMEDYHVTNCNQLPTTGNIDFYDMALFEPGSCGVTCYQQVTYNSSANYGQNNPSCGYLDLNGSGGSILYWSP